MGFSCGSAGPTAFWQPVNWPASRQPTTSPTPRLASKTPLPMMNNAEPCRLLLFHNLEAKFFNHRIGQHFLRNPLHLFLRFVAVPAIQVQHKKLPLPHVRNLLIPQARQRMVNRLSLRIQHRPLRHNPNMCLHAHQYINSLPPRVASTFRWTWSSAVIQNLTQPSQTQTETHSPPPSQSPPPSIQSSTHSDIPLPTTYETSPDHPWKSSPPPHAAKTQPMDAHLSSPYSSPTALPAPPSANCSPGRSPAESLFPQASPSTPHPESQRFHAQSSPRPESQSPHESFPARQFPPHASAGEIHTPRHVHKLPEIPLSPNSSHLPQSQTPQSAVIRTAAPPAPRASQPPLQTAAPHQKSSSAAIPSVRIAPLPSESPQNLLPAAAAAKTSRPPKASPRRTPLSVPKAAPPDPPQSAQNLSAREQTTSPI